MSSQAIAQLIKESKKTIVLSGAGMSTASGMPDYRSANGLWSAKEQMKLATNQSLHERSEEFWKFYWMRINDAVKLSPNPGHFALSKMQKLGFIDYIITQNVDSFHTQSGSSKVIHLHGNITDIYSTQNPEKRFSVEEAKRLAALSSDNVPREPLTGALLRPGVVFFGEMLPKKALAEADQLSEEADLILVCGTSLQVPPAATLPFITKENGGKVVLMNESETYMDDKAHLVSRENLAEQLPEILDILTK